MADTTMRAAFYEGARHFSTGSLPVPRPGPDEALLRVRRVGICGTDLHIFQGHLDHRVPKRGIIGHETFAHPASALLFACPNPASKRHSLVVYAGLSADATWHAVQAFPDCGGRGAEAIVFAHGAKPRPMVLSKTIAAANGRVAAQ